MLALSVNVQHLANYSVPPSVRFLMYKKETNNIYFERFILRNTICFVYWLVYSRQSMHISLFLSYHCVSIIHPFQPRTSFPQFSIVFSLFIFKIFNFFFFFQYCNTFIEFVTLLLLWVFFFFSFLVFWLQGMWIRSSLFRGQTRTLCIGRQSLNHWIIRESSLIISSM